MRRLARQKQENLKKARMKHRKNPIFVVPSADYVGAICELAVAYAFQMPLPKNWMEGFLGSDEADLRFLDGKSVDVKGRCWWGDDILLMVPLVQFFRHPKDIYILARLQDPSVKILGFITYEKLEKLRLAGQVKTFREDAGPTVYAKLDQLDDIYILHKRYGSRARRA